MRKLQFWVSASLLVAAMATFTIFIGCEDEPELPDAGAILDANGFENETRLDGEIPLLVSPTIDNVAVIGQRISFRAKGAVHPVAWSVGSPERGTVSTVGLRTDYALYESIAVAENTIVAIDAAGRSATATIKVGADPLEIIPTDITLVRPPAGPAGNLVVRGGVPPYSSWTELFPELGVVSQGGTYYVMNPTLIGTNIVTISDAAGDFAAATVSHVLDLDTLTIVSSTTSLSSDGQTASFIASGGLSPYAWELADTSLGHIVPGANSDIMVYERDRDGNQLIRLSDTGGDTAEVTVTQPLIALVVTPSPATLSTNGLITLTVSGGSPGYVWTRIDGNGFFSPGWVNQTTTGSTVIYRDLTLQTSILQITDTAGDRISVTITKE